MLDTLYQGYNIYLVPLSSRLLLCNSFYVYYYYFIIIYLLGRLFFYDHFHLETLPGFQKSGPLLLVGQEIGQKSQTIGRQKENAVRGQL